MEKIRIFLLDDHQIVRDGIRSLLEGSSDIAIIGEAADGASMLGQFRCGLPDVLLLDISLPGQSGIEIAGILTCKYPSVKILFLSMYLNADYIFNALKAGAKGYLHKNTTRHEMLEAIRKIYGGEEYFSEQVSNIILKSYIKKLRSDDHDGNDTGNTLSPRETEILKLFAEGLSNQEMADKLFISIRTVESHKNHIMQKLGLKSTVDLVKFAIRNKIIEI